MRPTMRALAVLCALAGPAWGRADEAPAAKATSEVRGRVTAVSADEKRLTVQTAAGDELKLRVNDDARLRLDGREATFKQFQVGDAVKVRHAGGRAVEVTSDAATARDVRREMSEA